MTEDRAKRRRPAFAAVLSFLLPGLGHLYSGRPKLGVAFFGLSVVGYLLIGLCFRILFLLYASQSGYLLVGIVTLSILVLSFLVATAWHSVTAARKAGVMRLRRYNRWYVYGVVLMVVNLLVLPSLPDVLPLRPFRISTEAMTPTLRPGDRVLARMYYHSPRPDRGDVVVFRSPPGSRSLNLKRVLGLPGETLTMRGTEVFLDGRRGIDKWGRYQHPSPSSGSESVVVTVPRDAVFVLGDNRARSYDSRHFGVVPLKSVVGRVLTIYSSPARERIGTRVE
jgi:signal peptidase I